MLKYQLIYRDEHTARYEYYPDGDKSNPGVVEFVDGVFRKISVAKDDEYGGYWIHARRIDLTTDSGTIAWY